MTHRSPAHDDGHTQARNYHVLSERHRAELTEGSGLTEDTIRAAGVHTEYGTVELGVLLNRRYPRTYGPALVFPYYDAIGTHVLSRVKPDNPPVNAKTGKPAKYLQPTSVPVRLYIPPVTFDVLDDSQTRLVITEGEKKALASTQAGFHAVGLAGVDNWHRKRRLSLMPDLERIRWRDRPVYIVFDSDASDNENILRNERELAAALASHGASVKVARIPPASGGAKQGIDDFIVAHGAAEFQRLLESAHDPEPPDADELKSPANDCDPAIEADHILALSILGDLPRLIFWRGSWWWWSTGFYSEISNDEVRAEVVNRLNERWHNVKSRHVSDVMEQLRAKSLIASSLKPPTWRGNAPHGWPADGCLVTRDAIVHLPSLVEGREPSQIPATPALLTTAATDFPFDLDPPRPASWLAFLDALWGDDPDSIEALQEWFGYLLTHDTRQQKLLLLVGPKRSGKGTIARVVTSLVGQRNVAAPTLGGMTTNFGLSPLIGKSVAIISDARLSGRADQTIVVERLLSVTGEDAQTVDRKHREPITLRLPTRFVILTNELPKFTDPSGALVSRVVLLRTTRSFYGVEDPELTSKLLIELPGILLWSIEGWNRLRNRGRFLQPNSGVELIGSMEDLASPVAAFVREVCAVGPEQQVTKALIYAAWMTWCRQQGRERHTGTQASFGRDLLAAIPGVRGLRPRVEGDRVQAYRGVGLRKELRDN